MEVGRGRNVGARVRESGRDNERVGSERVWREGEGVEGAGGGREPEGRFEGCRPRERPVALPA